MYMLMCWFQACRSSQTVLVYLKNVTVVVWKKKKTNQMLQCSTPFFWLSSKYISETIHSLIYLFAAVLNLEETKCTGRLSEAVQKFDMGAEFFHTFSAEEQHQVFMNIELWSKRRSMALGIT